jgi:hypothetical protein
MERADRNSKFTIMHLISKGILTCFVWALIFWLSGCSSSFWQQPGETVAEGHRRHLRMLRINQQQLVEDVDHVLLLDRPSRLTDKRIP